MRAFPRLLIGLVVLITAEVFSGASVGPGLWSPWTWVVTYWLYFAHFFFFTTLAVRWGRTSLGALYLWGVLFGFYESWITKVIWHGYAGDGKFALGGLGPFGYSEISMVFLFHPVMAFLLPLATACVWCPPLRRWFPDLAWLSGPSRWARATRIYVVLSGATTLGMNCGGPQNLCLNLAFLLLLLLLVNRLAAPGLAASDGRSLVVFGRRGLAGLCVYLILLYGITYVWLRPEGLPTLTLQLATLAFYIVPIAGLRLFRRREPLPEPTPAVDPTELRRVRMLFALVLGISLLLSLPALGSIVFVLVAANLIVWTPLGLVLTTFALRAGWREWRMAALLEPQPRV